MPLALSLLHGFAGGVREPALESIGLRFEIWSRQEGPDAVLGFVQPVRAAAFLQLLARTAPGQQVPAAVDSEIPLAYFWKRESSSVGPGPCPG